MNSSIQRPSTPVPHEASRRQPVDVDSRFLAQQRAQTTAGGGPVEVRVNLVSLLAQSAEELSQSIAGKLQDRAIKERKLSESNVEPPDRQRLRELLQAFREKPERLQGERAQQQTRAGTQAAGEQVATLLKKVKDKPGSIRQEVAEEVGRDPTEQYLLLLDMAYRFQDGNAGGDPGGRGESAVWEALEELSAERGEEIRADLNTFEATRSLAPEAAVEFRGAYKDVVLGSESLADVSKHILKATQGDTGAAFLKTLQSMTAALGLDLAALRSSAEPAKLKSLLSDLHNLETLATVVDRCNELSATLQARHGAPPLQATGLAADLVALSGERWMDSMRVQRLGEKHGSQHSLSTAVDLLTGMRIALRELPVWSYQSPEARDSVLEAVQDAMDAAIDREEGYA
jgi:type III secretion protein W